MHLAGAKHMLGCVYGGKVWAKLPCTAQDTTSIWACKSCILPFVLLPLVPATLASPDCRRDHGGCQQ